MQSSAKRNSTEPYFRLYIKVKVNFLIYTGQLGELLSVYNQSLFCFAVLTPQHYYLHCMLLLDSPS